MFKRILVPLDGSKLAELALPHAEELAGALNSEVVLVTVGEPSEGQYLHMHQLYIEEMVKLVKKETGAAEVKSVTLLGKPDEEIVDYAEKNDISLFVMASHGRSGIMRWSMGSVANKIIHRTNIPVLLIRAKVPSLEVNKGGLFNRILIPLDGSEAGEASLPYIRELTMKLSSEVILFQVIVPGQHVHTVGGLDYVLFAEHQVEAMKAEAKEYLEKMSQKLVGTKSIVRSEVRVGDTAQEILKFADETNSRLIAMSTHGHSGIRQWILGGIAYKIIQASNIPVLLVRILG